MRILMLGNSFTSTNHLPEILADMTGAEVIAHTRGGARLSEHLNPKTKMGARTQEALHTQTWDYVILQEMSNGPITAPGSFFKSVALLSEEIRNHGAVPVLYATWAYQKDGAKLSALGMEYNAMYHQMRDAYHRAAEENRALLADVGRLFYELSPSQNLYAADGVHPNLLGTQIAARTIAEALRK